MEISTFLYATAVLACKAGATILEEAGKGTTATPKTDGSPVSRADRKAQAVIINGLAEIFPGHPVIGEEMPITDYPAITGKTFLLVDPLDGTREFLAGRPDYTVNIACIESGKPVLGIIHAPALGLTYAGNADGAWRAQSPPGIAPAPLDFQPITTRALPHTRRVAYISRSHRDNATESFLNALRKNPANPSETVDRIEVLGSSLKFVKIAEGSGDLYPRLGLTMEWDTAAGQAILEAAGGSVKTPDGTPLRYGKFSQNLKNGPFIARGQR